MVGFSLSFGWFVVVTEAEPGKVAQLGFRPTLNVLVCTCSE